VGVKLDSTKSLQFNYAKTIRRPNFRNTSTITVFINPFLEGSNNVNLIPSITEELSLNFQWKDKTLNFRVSEQQNPIYYSIRYDEQADRAVLCCGKARYVVDEEVVPPEIAPAGRGAADCQEHAC
ncbi:MAG: outer membrane beta-barrel protein, partial [Planctomycetota bacterium]